MTTSNQTTVRVDLGERAYDVHVGPGVLAAAGAQIAALAGGAKTYLITNPTVDALYGDSVRAGVEKASGCAPADVVIPDGEKFKNLDTLGSIYDTILGQGADRGVVLIALGGGVVGDVAGFAAATVLRGVRLAMIPTTLLAQVDSSVGGKTAVNHAQGKNLIGAFHQPSLVVSDTDTFGTLPDREYAAGMAEVAKYGVILDADLFELLEKETAAVAARDGALLTRIVARSVELKAEVVRRDEREGGLRAILNYGHTVGHAIEKVTRYSRYLHGEAVAMGMVAAARVSEREGACAAGTADRIAKLLDALGLEVEIPGDIDRAAIETAIGFDKKVSGDQVTFILAEGIGSCTRRPMDAATIRAAIA